MIQLFSIDLEDYHGNKNVVMLSEESYNNMMENIYVMGTKSNYDWLMESKAQLENGMVSGHELFEVEIDE